MVKYDIEESMLFRFPVTWWFEMQTSVRGGFLCPYTIKPHCEWIGDCCTSLIYLNNDREVPAVVFLSRSIRALCWSSHPSWVHSEIQSPHPPWSPCHWTDSEDWEPSTRSAPSRKGPLIVCPVPQKRQKQVNTQFFFSECCWWSSWKHPNRRLN